MGCSFTSPTGDLHEMGKAAFHTSCAPPPPEETKPFTVNEEEEEVLKDLLHN